MTSTENSGDLRPALFLMVNSLERGGTERQFVTMAQCLTDTGNFSVRLGCLARHGEFLADVPEIEEFSPGRSLYKLQSHRTRMALARYLRENQISIAHAFDFYSNLMLIPAARVARVPVVIGSHRQLGDLQTPMQFRAQKTLFKMCDRVICNSQAAADRLREAKVAASKLAVIANALPEECFAPAAPALPARPGSLRVGMIARMNDPSKNHDRFLRMAAALAPRFPQVEFVLVGDGPLRPQFESLAAELGIASRVVFLGDRSDVTAVLASLDLTVLPSASESLSNVILESMAAGVPVVASNVGGNPEIIRNGENGFLAEASDEAFILAVGKLLDHEDLRKTFGEQSRLHARATYRIAQVREKYEQLYRSLLSGKMGVAEPRKVTSPA